MLPLVRSRTATETTRTRTNSTGSPMMVSRTPMRIFLTFIAPSAPQATATSIIARIHARPDTSKGLALGSGHQLVEELSGPRRPGDLEGNRPAVGLGRHG